jgi:hypothetical protein
VPTQRWQPAQFAPRRKLAPRLLQKTSHLVDFYREKFLNFIKITCCKSYFWRDLTNLGNIAFKECLLTLLLKLDFLHRLPWKAVFKLRTGREKRTQPKTMERIKVRDHMDDILEAKGFFRWVQFSEAALKVDPILRLLNLQLTAPLARAFFKVEKNDFKTH